MALVMLIDFVLIRFPLHIWQDELEEIAAAHEAGFAEFNDEDDEEISEEATKLKEEARMREDMADMGFD